MGVSYIVEIRPIYDVFDNEDHDGHGDPLRNLYAYGKKEISGTEVQVVRDVKVVFVYSFASRLRNMSKS